ncbi:MAG: hypothetical protein NW216_00860 [Hyphomicrobium sp.]|nr:hypothetical protein [Hyphomicrobium sp.]
MISPSDGKQALDRYARIGSQRRMGCALIALMMASGPSLARDEIAVILAGSEGTPATTAETAPDAQIPTDPRDGDPKFEEARRLLEAVRSVLADAADNRAEVKKLPRESEFIVPPLFTETRESREAQIRTLLDSALGIVTEVPVVEIQKDIEARRRAIQELENGIAAFRERRLHAPKDGTLPGVLTDTVASLDQNIADYETRIAENRAEITRSKDKVRGELMKSGVALEPGQVDLLLDGVLSSDLVRLVAVFDAAKLIDAELAKLITAAGENTAIARKYFAMHAALFAMLVYSQDSAIEKIDTRYIPRLDAILKDLEGAKARTRELLKAENRPDQSRALEANRESQKLAEDAAKAYRRYLAQQREQIAEARGRATHDLKIADNTFETVEASFQLQNLMREGATSFEALQKLEAPTFEQIFKNEELRREFESLTRKLDQPTS